MPQNYDGIEWTKQTNMTIMYQVAIKKCQCGLNISYTYIHIQ